VIVTVSPAFTRSSSAESFAFVSEIEALVILP
jgi:hypothetical protein